MQIPNDVAYCLYCGTKTSISKLVKYNRAVFFLTPIFLILVCLGITYDLGSSNFPESGIACSTFVICLYFLGALLFGTFKIFFKVPTITGCFLKSSFSSLINAVTTIFATFSIEELFLTNFFEKLGPINILKYHFLLMIIVYLTIQLLETLAISLYAKITDNPQCTNSYYKQIIFKYLYLEIPIDFIILTAILFYFVPSPSKMFFYSDTMLKLSAYEKANYYIDSGLEKYPDNDKLCFFKSIILTETDSPTPKRNQNKEKEALNYVEKAVSLKPDSPSYKYYLSIQLDITGNHEQAIQMASEASELAPKDAYLWQYLGDINQKYKKYSDSIKAYKKSLEIDPHNSITLNNLSYALLTNNQDYPIALELAKKAVKLTPNSISHRDTLAWAYYKNNMFTEALNEISLLYTDKTEISPEIDFHYAVILEEIGLLNNPVETYDKMMIIPEVSINSDLLQQIIEARNKAERKRKEKLESKGKE